MPRRPPQADPEVNADTATAEAPPERSAARPPKGDPQKNKLQALLWNPARKLAIDTKRNKDGSIDPSGQLQLSPGWNFVPLTLWQLAKENEQIVRLLEGRIPTARAVEESSEKAGEPYLVEGKIVDRDNPLRDLDMREALRFVQETLVIPTLKMLLGQESRAEVLRAIRDKIDTIEKPIRDAKAAKVAQGDT